MARNLPSLTLVGTPRFRPFRNVWLLEELSDALPAELGFRYEHEVVAPQSDEARAAHPMGKVPALHVSDGDDGDFTLIESAAINTWLGDRFREYCRAGTEATFVVPRPGSRDRAAYDSFIHFLMAEADSSGLWIHRKLESLGEKKAFGAVRYALLPACASAVLSTRARHAAHTRLGLAWRRRLQYDRAMAGVRAQLEQQKARANGAAYYLVGHITRHTFLAPSVHSSAHEATRGTLRLSWQVGSGFSAADVLLVHLCDWAEGIESDKGPAACWFSKYASDDVFQEYLRCVRARPAYRRAKEIQERSPVLT